MTPFFISYDGESAAWASHDLPVFPVLRSLFLVFRARIIHESSSNRSHALRLSGCHQEDLAGRRAKTVQGILLLTASPQFLLMGMTSYSMPLQLFLNLVWFWVYLLKTRLSFVSPALDWSMCPWCSQSFCSCAVCPAISLACLPYQKLEGLRLSILCVSDWMCRFGRLGVPWE